MVHSWTFGLVLPSHLCLYILPSERYDREGISWTKIDFADNQPCLDLIAKRPVGILHLLDDESNFPRGSDENFGQKCTQQHAKNKYFLAPRTRAPKFGIAHYAGGVWYEVCAVTMVYSGWSIRVSVSS